MKTINEIANNLVGYELLCEHCGTELNLFDDKCAYCREQTNFAIDGYYSDLREKATKKYENLLAKRLKALK